ncbi:ATP-dependent helicase [Chloroflexia bacterium SDU3-3]|nr:ATP-dependent helicase [Chloroflexia bacterium SDU3-3]
MNKLSYIIASESLRDNEGQWSAYESKGNCVILAGPGSGKTKTLTIKMARMLAEDIKAPRSIACITYNNYCVRELQRRLLDLGVYDGERVVISTLHSFCLQHIVIPYANISGFPIPDILNVATTEEQNEFWAIAVARVFGSSENPRDLTFRRDLYRHTHLDRDKDQWHADDENISKSIELYEQGLLDSGLIDFDMMIIFGLMLVEKYDWVRKCLKARFPIIVVDEYQDLGFALHRIVLSLCVKAGIRLVAVGDPDQSIYGFTGADPSLVQDLAGKPDIERIQLKLNYRCGSAIIRASEIALGEYRGFRAGTEESGVLYIHEKPSGFDEQASFICKTIIPDAIKRREGRRFGDIAILYRDKYHGDKISMAVENEGWDFIRIDQGNPYIRTPIIFWLEDCAAWCGGGWEIGNPHLSELVRKWQNFNYTVTTDADRRILRHNLVKFLYSHRNTDQYLRDWLSEFREACLDFSLNREPRLREEVIAISKLAGVCDLGSRLAGFTVLAFGGQRGTGTHLNLMTLHSAKGLEFDVVILPFLEEGILPNYRAKKEKQMQEERRLFYVGLTRARHEVHLLYSGWYSTPYGRHINGGESRFITEVRHLIS